MTASKAGSYVISIGNLTWGGTGKTSMVKELAQVLMSHGLCVAIVSRGYRRKTAGPLLISDGSGPKASWQESGDEAFLLSRAMPQAIVVVAEKRVQGLKLLKPFAPDVILLDDAFQHRKVGRDLDMVLIDASENITRQKVIPFGKLRESSRSVSRADVVVLTHQKQANVYTTEWVSKNIQVPVFHANYLMKEGPVVRGKKIAGLCAIGAPQHFFRLLSEEGADLVATESFRDHHVFTTWEIEAFRRNAVEKGAEFIATTEKDAVRMDPAWFDPFLKVIHVKLQIVEESLFFDFVMNAVNRAAVKRRL